MNRTTRRACPAAGRTAAWRRVIAALACLALAPATLALAPAALAQTPWPAKPVKITLPYSAAAGPTVFMRVMADKLTKLWGQQVLIEPRPGASGFIAIEAVKNALPDAHELLIVSNAHMTINPSLYKKLPYDPERDFAPIATVYHTPFFITVASNGPYQSVPALIAGARANPGKLSYGTPYVGSPSHLGSALLESLTNTKMVHVPYKDQSQIYVDIANGDLTWALSTVGSALPLTRAGKVKLLAIARNTRLKTHPDVPTVAEAGGPAGLEVDSWLALLAPRGTPPDTVRRINADVNRVLADPDVVERLSILGFEGSPSTPDQLVELIRSDMKVYGDLVRRTGATAE
jgi:tripartite-type tricarboxylate transporter receptor subunit TctC